MSKLNGNILIIDDNEKILKSLKLLLKHEFNKTETLNNPEQIPSRISSENYDIILLDMNFKAGVHSGNEGIYWLRRILEIDANALVIMITAYGDISLAVKAIKEGALDFIQKPWDPDKLITTLKTALKLKKSREEVVHLKKKQSALNESINKPGQEIIGTSLAMKKVLEMVHKVAKTNANVLILGENGTGKELIAREIHNHSKRNRESFVSVDLGSVSESLFEAELFGHVKGAFTDAKTDRMGRFESANKGTLFLDEIGNIPVSLQAKILSALQNREIFRVGSQKALPIDIRLISATNKSLQDMISSGLFREDLYFRINTIEIILPPLRQRGEDIIKLTEYYLNTYRKKYDKPQIKINEAALEKLLKYRWPGNIRELKHAIERAVILNDDGIITEESFFFGNSGSNFIDFQSYKLEDVEKNIIKHLIELHKGNMSKIAKELNVSRTTLYAKIKKYGIE